MATAHVDKVLGIAVTKHLLDSWIGWFAPDEQPFLVDEWPFAVGEIRTEMPLELRDTFEIYNSPVSRREVWLSELDFLSLPRAARSDLVRQQVHRGRGQVPSVRMWGAIAGPTAATQVDGHRFVWWRHLLAPDPMRVLEPYLREGRLPSRHVDVGPRVWEDAARLLPRARELAGRFPEGSGPNCFGMVMAAAGVHGAEFAWMEREPFERWLVASTEPGGHDDQPGTVLVWRAPDGAVEHAAVTLGAGFAFHKPSQGWMSPTKVLRVDEVKRSSRAHGRRLSRYRVRTAT